MTVKLGVVAFSLAAAIALANDESAWHEPLPAKSLSGQDIALSPRSLAGGVLIIGFSRASNAQTRAWGQRLTAHGGNVPIYRVVVMAGAPRFVRRMAVRGIRSSVAEATHEFFYVVEERAEAWRELVRLDDEDAAYVLRLDDNGHVCVRHQGEVTDAAFAKVVGACEQAHSQGQAP